MYIIHGYGECGEGGWGGASDPANTCCRWNMLQQSPVEGLAAGSLSRLNYFMSPSMSYGIHQMYGALANDCLITVQTEAISALCWKDCSRN